MDLYDEIAKVAYDIFEKEGCVHGRHFEHWIQAEIIVKSRYEKKEEPVSDDEHVLKTEKKDKAKTAVKKASAKKPATKKSAAKKTVKE